MENEKMINDLKDIEDILKELDKITFEQLDRAIKETDEEFELWGVKA